MPKATVPKTTLETRLMLSSPSRSRRAKQGQTDVARCIGPTSTDFDSTPSAFVESLEQVACPKSNAAGSPEDTRQDRLETYHGRARHGQDRLCGLVRRSDRGRQIHYVCLEAPLVGTAAF